MGIRYDTQQLLNDADMVEVAQEIGIRMKSSADRTRNIGILCPNPRHSDRNFGNCFIRPDGYYECFSCGDRGNVFHMVMQYTGASFPEAIGIVADTCGGRDHYILSGTRGKYAVGITVLNQKECKLLGVCNSRIYIPVRYGEEMRAEAGEREKLAAWNEEDEPVFLIEQCAEKNPLLELMKTDYECYRSMILRKAQEAIQKRQNTIEECGEGPRLEAEDVEWCMEIETEIEQIEDVLLKYFPKDEEVKKITSHNAYGKELIIGSGLYPVQFSVPF